MTMPQPDVRKRLTASIQRLPGPIPRAWQLVDELHFRLEAVVERSQRAHTGIGEAVFIIAGLLGVPAAIIANLRSAHGRVNGRTHSWLHTAHWYV